MMRVEVEVDGVRVELEVDGVRLARRDCRWLGDVLVFLLERRYFAQAPDIEARALLLVADARQEVDKERQELDKERQCGDELLSYEQAAEEMGCSLRTIDRRVADGSLPVIALGGLRRVRRSDVERMEDR
jgi:excisionase family DNA binding protein